jgi:hypothetical protein
MQNNFNNIYDTIKEHPSEIKDFIVSNFSDTKSSVNIYKISINCPWCDDNRHRHKLVINIDYGGTFKCFRCGKTGSLYHLCKEIGCEKQFSQLVSSISNISLINIQNVFKHNINDDINKTIINNDENENKVNDFINSRGLIKAKQLSDAYKYSLERVYNNKDEANKYFADNKYIYIPIITNRKTVSFVGRLYIDDNLPRYIIHPIEKEELNIGFFDDVISNVYTDSIYITEGYFDSYAINYAIGNAVSICAFGKGKVISVIKELAKYFSPDTKIYLTLDSAKKDKDIIKNNIMYGKKIQKTFQNLFVVELPDSDPADILKNNGTIFLKETLQNYSIPFIKYMIKYAFKF